MSSAQDPYLSVVVATRNDDHGGDALRRMQIFVRGLVEQCDRHRLPAELLVVEWNPPPERPRIDAALDWPAGQGWCAVRVVEVPPDRHRRLAHSDKLPLFQFVAKNVGIRRARGQFVLATNMDVLFSDELIGSIAKRRLRSDRIYRVDRSDVPAGIDASATVSEQLAWCARNVIRVNRREGTLDPRTGEWLTTYRAPRTLTRWRNSERSRSLRRRIPFHEIELGHHPALDRVGVSLWQARFALSVASSGLSWALADPGRAVGRIRDRLRTLEAAAAEVEPARAHSRASRLTEWRRHLASEAARMRLHMNGSGDFTLMSKDAWLRTGGYPELELYSMHLDGLHLYQAQTAGIRERFLPYAIYHVDHGGGFQPEAKGDETVYASLQRRGIPYIEYERLMRWFYELYVTRRPIRFNDDGWGFRDEVLPETVVSPGAPARPGARSSTPPAGPRG